MKQCSVEGCEDPGRIVKGMCIPHYYRFRRTGSTDPRKKPDAERFWSFVDKSQDCWEWQGCKGNGYGRFGLNYKVVPAHRYSYELTHGEIPEGLMIDHICHNRACVNPAHLRLADKKQNAENLRGANRNSKSGIRGVFLEESSGRWVGFLFHHGKRVHVGRFATSKEAESSVIAARNELYTHNDVDRRDAA